MILSLHDQSDVLDNHMALSSIFRSGGESFRKDKSRRNKQYEGGEGGDTMLAKRFQVDSMF